MEIIGGDSPDDRFVCNSKLFIAVLMGYDKVV
jgi:hypothetical protein